MKFYDYHRSSAGYRLRLALNLKGLSAERHPVHMVRSGGEQKLPEYLAKNPLGLVPTLETEDGRTLQESLAIIEYLDATHPHPRLIPEDPWRAARVRAASYAIACDIHPLNNLRVLKYLEHEMGQDKAAIDAWYAHWIRDGGLKGVQRMIEPAGRFCFGDQPTMADCCLVPQLFNARRFEVPLDGLERLVAIETACNALEAFQKAHPARQSDAE